MYKNSKKTMSGREEIKMVWCEYIAISVKQQQEKKNYSCNID